MGHVYFAKCGKSLCGSPELAQRGFYVKVGPKFRTSFSELRLFVDSLSDKQYQPKESNHAVSSIVLLNPNCWTSDSPTRWVFDTAQLMANSHRDYPSKILSEWANYAKWNSEKIFGYWYQWHEDYYKFEADPDHEN